MYTPGVYIVISALVIPGRNHEVWIWQNPQEHKISSIHQLYESWSSGLEASITYRDIEDLYRDLTQEGLNIHKESLGFYNPGNMFAEMIKNGGFLVGA